MNFSEANDTWNLQKVAAIYQAGFFMQLIVTSKVVVCIKANWLHTIP